MKKNKGITLIALVITIVILIILAGVSINILLGENGLITKANQAALVEKDKQVETEIKLAINSYTIDKVKNPNVDLKQVLKQELEEQYLGKVIETEKNIIIEYKDKEYKIEIETGKIEENSNYDLWDGKSISIGLVGEGTEEKPYLIRSANDLAYMNEQTSTAISFITPDIIGLEEDGITPNGHNMCANDANYKLMCNIALNDISEFDK